MKVCLMCKQELSLDKFHLRQKRGSQITNAYCKECQKIYQREHYAKNRKSYNDRTRRFRKEIAEWAQTLKESQKCVDCSIEYPAYVLQWDHLSDKKFNVSYMTAHGHSKQAILEEIEKCELVCANCHAIRTYSRKETNKKALEFPQVLSEGAPA